VIVRYAAVANRTSPGCVTHPDTDTPISLFRPDTLRALHGTLLDPDATLPPPPGKPGALSRMSWGFSPWAQVEQYGATAPNCVGHAGIGGCFAYADLELGLAVCVMKNAYEPYTAVGTASPDVVHICRLLRTLLCKQEN